MKSVFEKYGNFLQEFMKPEYVEDLKNRWNEPHRFYHTEKHLEDILNSIESSKSINFTKTYDENVLAAFFHDAVYIIGSDTNEDDSIELVYKYISDNNIADKVAKIVDITRNREFPSVNEPGYLFWFYDNDILFSSFDKMLDWEDKIFKEYQKYDYSEYKKGRIQFLEQYSQEKNIQNLIGYVKNRKPKIGLYAGSFNPWHIGHQNILEKSEKIFDKVIIAYGVNPEKGERDVIVPNKLNNQVKIYNGLLVDVINDLEKSDVDIILIRGLRNGYDLEYESNQIQFLKEMKPDIKVIMILCDKEYEHISSSAIRGLEKFNKDLVKKYV